MYVKYLINWNKKWDILWRGITAGVSTMVEKISLGNQITFFLRCTGN